MGASRLSKFGINQAGGRLFINRTPKRYINGLAAQNVPQQAVLHVRKRLARRDRDQSDLPFVLLEQSDLPFSLLEQSGRGQSDLPEFDQLELSGRSQHAQRPRDQTHLRAPSQHAHRDHGQSDRRGHVHHETHRAAWSCPTHAFRRKKDLQKRRGCLR